MVGVDGFLIGLFAFGVGMVYFGPRRENKYAGIVAIVGAGSREFGKEWLIGEMSVGEGIGDTPVEEEDFVAGCVLSIGVNGTGEHQPGIRRYIAPRKSIPVLCRLFPDDLPGDFGNTRKTPLLQLF